MTKTDHLAVVGIALSDGRMPAMHEAICACAADHASAFTALNDWERAAVAARFQQTMLAALDRCPDETEAYTEAYFASYAPLVAELDAMVTGGADWSVDEAYALHANRDMEGLFLLRDGEWGCWSVVHRLHDEDGNAEIVPLVEDDDWPVVVNEALRLARAAA
jgi:hypothetical protein